MKRSEFIQELKCRAYYCPNCQAVTTADAEIAADYAEEAGVEWDPEAPDVAHGARELAMRLFYARKSQDYTARAITNAVHPLVEALEAAHSALQGSCPEGIAPVKKKIREAIHTWETGE